MHRSLMQAVPMCAKKDWLANWKKKHFFSFKLLKSKVQRVIAMAIATIGHCDKVHSMISNRIILPK